MYLMHMTLEARKRVKQLSRKRVIILPVLEGVMRIEQDKRTMPVCFTPEQLRIVEEYARKKGMLNASQALEELARS